MRCPFLITRKDLFDEEGKKIGEEIMLKECVKTECMVYDGAKNLCSLLSSNIKAGVLIDEVKAGIENIKDEVSQRSETLGTTVPQSLQAMQEALSGRLDILKKQNEVMVLGFDRLSEVFNSRINDIKEALSNFTNSLISQFDVLKNSMEKLTATNRVGMETLSSANQAVLKKFDVVDSLSNSVGTMGDLLKQSSDSLTTMSDMMSHLNRNYLESLGKIAGLAEGMRTGVEKVGTGMHDSVKDLVAEMKKEIGTLEKQYEKSFGDVAKLAGTFGELNTRIKEMTTEVQKEFKESFERQTKLSNYTKNILEHIRTYFEKEEARYQEEQRLRKKKEGIDHFDRATLYYYRGNYEVALTEINKALEMEKTAEYLNLKGLLLAELGRFDESKNTYVGALKLEPHLAEIHNNLGLLYLKTKKLDDAVVSFQEALKKNANYALAYVNLGKALIDLERFDEALKSFERALKIDPSNRDAQEAINLYREGKIGV
ncbi:MAG: tetratricopeptide repeat protein [candidate division WOR-3 bacterium]|nr:MAG: tetratricopeptide repeat protein [candidate division WOR-3 bacterium]